MVFDGLGRVASTWVGTNDTPTSGEWSPTNNTGTANMVQVTANIYDNGGVGDSNLTQVTQIPGGTAANRVSQFFFDWRDRQVASKAGVQASEDTTTHRPIMYFTYDNLDEVLTRSQYDGDGVTITSTNGVPNAPSASLLRAKTTFEYDDQGRVFQTHVFSVDPSSGAVSTNSLNTNFYFNHRGLLIAVSVPGGLVTKRTYDGAGRDTVQYTTDGAGGNTWANAGSVTGDDVLEQQEYTYDANSNAIMTVNRQRNHDETATGALGNPTTAPKARVYYAAAYYDLADRLTDSVNVGTNGGTAYTRPGTVPARSDTVLVTSFSYNAAGWVQDVTDPRGLINRTLYDALARTTSTIQDYTTGTPTASSDQTTDYTYDGNDHVLTVQAQLPAGSVQTTQYNYGVTTATGSDVNSNDILASVQYPDLTTGNPSSTLKETYTVNALGQTKTFTDRNGNVHTFSYDVLGRRTSDAVTTLGAGVDGSVRRIDTAFDTQGNAFLFTSYADVAGTTIVNQVQRAFNGLGQLTNEYQSHSGAVNTSTTPQVQYGYTLMSGGANHSRLVSMTYPNGRVLNYNYNTGLDSNISRLSSISDSSATLESYKYLGLSTVVERDHPQDGVNLTYIGTGTSDGGDKYVGLDRFGRVVDQLWTTGSTTKDEFTYTYDRDSNALTKTNTQHTAFNESYTYDGLNRLLTFTRGTHTINWALDAQGNFSSTTTDGGSAVNRTHNAQNEVTGVGSATLSFDNNGNTTKDQNGQQYVFDAWNRLITIKNAGGTAIQTYGYDALGRRITENSGTIDHLYYSALGQIVEERFGTDTTADVQYVWCPCYVNAIIERDKGTGSTARLYVAQDANYNVTALFDTSGTVQERTNYDPYGAVTFYDASWNVRASSSFSWQYTFQGARQDFVAQLDYMGLRVWSYSLGRWLQQDPLGFGGGYTNLYSGMGDQPVNGFDPSGMVGEALTISGLISTLPEWGPLAIVAAPYVVIAGGLAGVAYTGHELYEAIGESNAAREALRAAEVQRQVLEASYAEMLAKEAAKAKAAEELARRKIKEGIDIRLRQKEKCKCKIDDSVGAIGIYPGPYAFLERSDRTFIAPGRDFTPMQRQKILVANMEEHGGVLMSDDPNDPVKGPLVWPTRAMYVGPEKGVPPNQAQVDHIKPQIAMGSNSYCNAQVISQKLNLMKRDGQYPGPK